MEFVDFGEFVYLFFSRVPGLNLCSLNNKINERRKVGL